MSEAVERIALQQENQMLRGIIDHAREGHWCIEFLEPVDISGSRDAIIAQVFENASVWKLTNSAVARIDGQCSRRYAGNA